MDSFESLITTILERDGYWVRPGFKVELTKEEKQRIGRPSCPRWELDVVGYKAAKNELLVVECKSYLDSPGVRFESFGGEGAKNAERFKLFNDDLLREVVFGRLKVQLAELGSCVKEPSASVQLCLAAGRIASDADRASLEDHFKAKGWWLWDDRWLRDALGRVAASGYDNQVAAVVAKILLRK